MKCRWTRVGRSVRGEEVVGGVVLGGRTMLEMVVRGLMRRGRECTAGAPRATMGRRRDLTCILCVFCGGWELSFWCSKVKRKCVKLFAD